MLHLIIAAVALGLAFGYHKYSKQENSPFEVAMEEIITEETGMHIDLSAAETASAPVAPIVPTAAVEPVLAAQAVAP